MYSHEEIVIDPNIVNDILSTYITIKTKTGEQIGYSDDYERIEYDVVLQIDSEGMSVGDLDDLISRLVNYRHSLVE